MATPLLGWVEPINRTPNQQLAHELAMASMPKFIVPGPAPQLAKGESICLYDSWKNPAVIADCNGITFCRFHQLTGSCVGAGGGNALFSLIAVQRTLPDTPTKAFIPFWPFDYGRARYTDGFRGEGEGAMGSGFARTVVKEGVFDSNPAVNPNLPVFSFDDKSGHTLTSQLEMKWSNGGSPLVTNYLPTAKLHPLGAAAPCTSVQDIRTAITNGYACSFACNNYIGQAKIEGSGTEAVLIGYWDGRGGHQQSIHAYYEHPTFGPLYWAQNNWDFGTYVRDPFGGPVCGCWVREAKVVAAMQLDSEVFAFSHLNWFPAQPDVMNYYV